jgi:diadenosine tetraphosphate (Ap4A) HIT family hydrolase
VERLEQLSEDEIIEIHKIIQKTHIACQNVFKTKSYMILQKNGKEVGQTVDHIHFHYIPRMENDDSILGFLFRFLIYPLKSKLSEKEMKNKINLISNSLKN